MTIKDKAIVFGWYAQRAIRNGDEFLAYSNAKKSAEYGLEALREAEQWREMEQDMEVSK